MEGSSGVMEAVIDGSSGDSGDQSQQELAKADQAAPEKGTLTKATAEPEILDPNQHKKGRKRPAPDLPQELHAERELWQIRRLLMRRVGQDSRGNARRGRGEGQPETRP